MVKYAVSFSGPYDAIDATKRQIVVEAESMTNALLQVKKLFPNAERMQVKRVK